MTFASLRSAYPVENNCKRDNPHSNLIGSLYLEKFGIYHDTSVFVQYWELFMLLSIYWDEECSDE